MRYLEFGSPNINSDTDRQTHHILFIHGLGASADRWLDFPEALAKSYHTIAIDLIGFGKSDTPNNVDYNIGFFRDCVTEFMRTIGIDRDKTCLIGHSLGGYIAAEVAIENGQLVNKLVLIDSSGVLNGPTSLLEQYLHVAMNPSFDNVRNVFQQMMANPSAIVLSLVDLFIYRLNMPNAKYSFRSTYENSTRTRILPERLKTICKIQTLIIWGRNDALIPIEYLEIFRNLLTAARIEIVENAGHAPFAEKPLIVYEAIRTFLR
jgi:pimeloyl-ACP methyl ester carboxylesterase